MTENTNDQPTIVVATGLSDATITATKIGKVIPDAYRLVRFRTEEGQIHLKLQGYFTWTQGWLNAGANGATSRPLTLMISAMTNLMVTCTND